MNREEGIQALAALFGEAAALNREALNQLNAGQGLETLQAIFLRKESLSSALEAVQAQLGSGALAGAQDALQGAFQAQREAATSEALLAEALGKIVPQSGKAARAYDSFKVEKALPKVDSSI